VVFGKPNLHGLYDKLGITKDSVQRGRNAGIDSDYTSLDAAQRALMQRGIDQSYHEFVAKVATARNRAMADIEPVAQGRVWLGSQAKPRGWWTSWRPGHRRHTAQEEGGDLCRRGRRPAALSGTPQPARPLAEALAGRRARNQAARRVRRVPFRA